MSLKRKISKDVFEKLNDTLKAFYEEKDGNFVVKAEFVDFSQEDEDTSELKRAKDREKQRAKEAEAEAKELKAKLAELDNSDARKKGDIDALEKSWKEKSEAQIKELSDKHHAEFSKVKSGLEYLKQTSVDNIATKIATDISTTPSLMAMAIKSRISIQEGEDGTFKTQILDASGKPSAQTIEELKKEFVENKEYSTIIKSGNSSGSGTSNNSRSSSGAANGSETKDFSRMSNKEYAEYRKANRENNDDK